MNSDKLVVERIIQKVEQLSTEEIREVENFINHLNQRKNKTLTQAAVQLSEPSF